MKPNKTKLSPVQVAFYAIQPGNGLGQVYNNSAGTYTAEHMNNKVPLPHVHSWLLRKDISLASGQ